MVGTGARDAAGEDAAQGCRAQVALFEEALEDYHSEVAVAREKASAEGLR